MYLIDFELSTRIIDRNNHEQTDEILQNLEIEKEEDANEENLFEKWKEQSEVAIKD